MKKRLLSLLVALCMAVTLLPVSALTAWAEGGDQLKIADGYPVGSIDANGTHTTSCSGDGWSYDGTTLDLHPASPTEYDFFSIISGYGNVTKCKLTIGGNATIVRGNFDNAVINNGKISGGYFFSSSSSLINHGSITGGKFLHAISNESSGTIENGTFISVTNNGTINGGIFRKKPEGGHVAKGYTLNVNLQNTGIYKISRATINGLNGGCYIIPNSDHDTSVTIHIFFLNRQAILFPIDVTFGDTNGTSCLLKDWAPSASYSTDHAPSDSFFVTFTAPSTGTDTVTLSMLTRLVIDENGYPVGPMGSNKKYSGNGWKFDASNNTLTLESGRYDFSGEKNALRPLNPNVQLVVESGAKLTGGAAGDGSGVTWQLTENTDDPSTYKLTISGSGSMKNFPFGSDQPWYSFKQQITSVVIHPGVTSIGECAFSWFPKLTHVDIADSVISIGGNAFKSCSSLTNITIPQNVTYIGGLAFSDCTSLSSITLSNNITFIGNAAFKNCTTLTSITIPSSVTSIGSNVFTGCTSLNDIRYSGTSESVISALSGYAPTLVTFDYGDKVPEAERMIKVFVKTGGTLTAPTTLPTVSGYEFKGWRTKDDEPYDFTVAPTGKFTLYANWEKIPDPKPEPKPEPEPEASTYTLTVKGGTFTYNGGEAMTSASVPVDAEVKVTLNQSAVPEGMVFDLWAMDEASLLGNPAVAYNEESFTIPAGSVAKGSTVTVEAQYRDATIESEPSVLGTAAIIGVAGAGTAVIVWQGYRIGMELYEKYFQPTPEETAAEQPAPEAPAAAAAS